MVSIASIANYYQICEDGTAKRQIDKIMAWILKNHVGRIVTAHVIAKDTGMVIQTVSGRVSDLVKDGYLLQSPTRSDDPITGNPSHRVYPIFVQGVLL